MERLSVASEGADSRASLQGFLLTVAWTAREHETVVRRFRQIVPTNSTPLPPELADFFDAILWSLNEMEGPSAVRALVEAQSAHLASDSLPPGSDAVDRFFLDHAPPFDSIRDRPEFQAVLDELAAYSGPDAPRR